MTNRISIHPDICNGWPVIAGTRIPVQTIMEFLGAGDSIDEVLDRIAEARVSFSYKRRYLCLYPS